MTKIYELFASIEETYGKGLASRKSFRHVKQVYKIFIAFWSSAVMSCLVGGIAPFKSRDLPYRMWLPEKGIDNDLVFWLSAMYQTINTTCLSGVDIVLDVLPVFFMSYVLEMLEELCEQLERIKSPTLFNEDEMEDQSNRKLFIKCIKLHSRIVGLARNVEDIFAIALLMRGLMSTLIFCTTAFALTVVSILVFKWNKSVWLLMMFLIDISNRKDSRFRAVGSVHDSDGSSNIFAVLLLK